MLGAAMLARTAKLSGNRGYSDVARSAMEYSCTRQLVDGAWYYAELNNMHWIDNFHTGYNLDSLKCYLDATGETNYESNLRKGFNYYIEHFFEHNGCPKYYHKRAHPIDIQCAAQAIETLTLLADYDDRALPTASKVADWTINKMQDKSGHFYYRIYPWGVMKTPMLHWGQATMYKALTSLLLRLQASNN
jgi:rhamnogalacturonyl hydrolase YesR